MERITCKFGGSSLADAACIRQVIDIIRANPSRKYIVPSAPGKRTADEQKITDLLYAWHSMARRGLDPAEPKGIIEERFSSLARELGVSFNVQPCLEEISRHAAAEEAPDYMASRGEYIKGRLMAEALGATVVDPTE